MAKWVRKETGRAWNPYYYMCELGDLKLDLSVPYRSDPWGVRLTKQSITIYKEHFRLPDSGKLQVENQVSEEELKKAKEKAFAIVKQLTEANINYWTAFLEEIKEMEGQGKEDTDGEEEQAADPGANE